MLEPRQRRLHADLFHRILQAGGMKLLQKI
jgi:hypothetical protein